MTSFLTSLSVFLLLLTGPVASAQKASFSAVLEAEESVYTYESANNGAGPMWTHGNTCIVRYGKKVFASGIETLPGEKPLNNVRWMLYERDKKGWKLLIKDPKDRTREPCPLGIMDDGRLFLSVNPTLTESGAYNGPSDPQILQFDARHPDKPYKVLRPVWEDEPPFTEHSYRTFVTDGRNGEMILFQNIGYTHAEWSFFDKDGRWSARGRLVWPEADYDDPQPCNVIRVCYPAVQLKERKVYFLGVSDIMEPKKAWREYKYQLTQRKWDYDFRRLFYTWSEDITTGKFEKWVEIASREETGGRIFPADLWVAPGGDVYVLWHERALDERLQEKFFPAAQQSEALNFAVIRDGKVVFRKTIMQGTPGEVVPGWGRFQVTGDNRLFVFYYVHGGPEEIRENRIVEISTAAGHAVSRPVTIGAKRPLSMFYTANVRAGNAPSSLLDVYGQDEKLEMRYMRIRIR